MDATPLPPPPFNVKLGREERASVLSLLESKVRFRKPFQPLSSRAASEALSCMTSLLSSLSFLSSYCMPSPDRPCSGNGEMENCMMMTMTRMMIFFFGRRFPPVVFVG